MNKENTRINNKVVTDVEIKTVLTFPKQKVVDKEKVCLFTPHHPICDPDKDGKCPNNWSMNEDGQCFPHYKKCPPNYWRADDDERGACVKIPKEPIYAPDDPFCAGDPKHIGCPRYYDVIAEPEPKTYPEPVVGKCFNGATPVNGVCPKPTDDPNMKYCEAYGCPGSPAIPIEEEDEGPNDVVVNDEDNTDNEELGPEVEADEENQNEGESSGDGGQSDEEMTSG